MITTNSEELASFARIVRDQGKESFNSGVIVELGYNWRMPEMSAALGLVQLRRLQEFIGKRNAVAKVYDSGFDAMGIERVVTPENQLNNYYKYTFFLPGNVNRDRFKTECRQRGVAYGGEVMSKPHLLIFGSKISCICLTSPSRISKDGISESFITACRTFR